MQLAWHPIRFNKDGDAMVCYEFNITWVCFVEEPVKIKFHEERFEWWKGKVMGMRLRNTFVLDALIIFGIINVFHVTILLMKHISILMFLSKK
jgi:hypothetical protein